jgi:hypothetical protein
MVQVSEDHRAAQHEMGSLRWGGSKRMRTWDKKNWALPA